MATKADDEAAFKQLHAMVSGKNPAEPDEAGLTFLQNFAADYDDMEAFTQVKDRFENTELLPGIMRLCASSNRAVMLAALRLLMLYSRTEAVQKAMSKSDILGPLLNTMRTQSADLEVQEEGCRLLVNLSTYDKNRRVLAKEGAVDVVLDGLRNGGSSKALQLAACWAARNLAVNDANKKVIAQKGGIELVVRLLEQSNDILPIQLQGCWTLQILSLKDEHRDPLIKAGALAVLASAMRQFPDERRLHDAVTWAISNFSESSKCREALRKAELVDLLMAAATKFSESDVIPRFVSQAISAMSEADLVDSDDESAADAALAAATAAAAAPPPPPPSSDASSPPAVVRKGYMTKQGGRIKTWKKRWFVLDNRRLSYFKAQSDENGTALGVINLALCRGVLEDPSKKNGLLLVTAARTFKMFANSRHEMSEWMLSLKKTLEQVAPLITTAAAASSAAAARGSSAASSASSPSSATGNGSESHADEAAAPIVPGPADMASSSVALDFFAVAEQKTPREEVAPLLMGHVIHVLQARATEAHAAMAAAIAATKRPELTEALVARTAVKLVGERSAEAAILSIKGTPTEFLDAIRLIRICNEVLPTAVEQAVAESDGHSAPVRPWRAELWAEQGPRKTMEDRHALFTYLNEVADFALPVDMSFYGVFDGHGGTLAAEYVSAQLHSTLLQEISVDPSVLTAEAAPEEDPLIDVIKRAFVKTNENFFESMQRQNNIESCGSTGVVALFRGRRLYICWAGDSEVLIAYRDETKAPLRVCETHKASLESEQRRIEELGGFVQEVNGTKRLNGILAVTRSFGDARFKRFVTAEPSIKVFDLDGSEDFIILACDGLWDVMQPEQMVGLMGAYRTDNKGESKGAAKVFVDTALDMNSTDNVSVITIVFDKTD